MKRAKCRMADGLVIEAEVVETLGWNHDAHAYVREMRVPVSGRVFMAVGSRGFWREWGARDRLRPGSKVTGQTP